MDSASRRPQLPALSYLDVDKTKREEETFASRDVFGLKKQSGAAIASPTHTYPSGPPPPYTHAAAHQTSPWNSANGNTHTPPESRRTSGDDHENTKTTSRQSLPSISEALGPGPLEGQTPYQTTPASAPQSQAVIPQLATPKSAPPLSPRNSVRRSYPMEPPQQQSHAHYSLFRQDSAGPNTYASSSDAVKPPYGPSDARHTLNGQPGPRPSAYSYPPPPAISQYESPNNIPASSAPPPPATFRYGYASYPQRYTQSTTTTSSGPIYQPSAHSAPPPHGSPWKPDTARHGDERASAPYGESIKRHLEVHDLEMSLNEVGQMSSIVLDFSRRYGDQAHHSARGAMSLSTLPGIVEVEDMMSKSRVQLEALTKIREFILTEQAVHEQQLAEQRHKAFMEAPLPAPRDQDMDADEGKGGFGGSDPKKPRRGRAAPPGRCHSCNRAETPEWRRGPDGARTLCNACGLHYAKLTRKQTTGSKSGNVGSSNLRPKEA